ncbi:UBP1-associated protein 2A-like [Prosopis cineraria]|uniref:UBP1-associated protein 2A-like n=1 Tax=Prosopis cineraria TaxID=364024 RepID=UPI00240F7BF9|nr:UBP1-associated protein 2A-like [Prosopis cineraria]XP_054796458.1 UBP1-associated protein 2A-like [Prosopis cineraria]
MAKKRKIRSSEIESAKTSDSQPAQQEQTQEQQIHEEVRVDEQPNPEATLEEEHQGHETMAVDDDTHQEDVQLEENADAGVSPEVHPQEQVVERRETAEAVTGAAPSESAEVDANGAEEGNENDDDDEVLDEEEPLEKLLEPFTKEQLYSLVKQAAEKYPDFIDNVRQLADVDPAHRKIFIHGLGWDTTAETLTSVFGKYGEIEDCKAVIDRVSGKSKGYAFILFKHRSGARKALKQPQKKIGNRTTSCQLASAGPVPSPATVAPPVSEYTQRKIFVSNVSAELDPQKLLEFFGQFGEIEDGPLGLDKQTGKPKGFALFVYKSVESAKKALEEPHKNFEGHTLYCQKAVDGPKGNKGYQHHQQQHHSHHHQPHYQSRKEKTKYQSGGHGPGPGHLMAPSAPSVGFNPGVAAQGLNPALGQALTALLTTQGAGLGLGNLLGGLGGAPTNQAGPPAGYVNQPAVGYGNQPGMQGGYQNPQMGQSSGVRPHPGPGAPYMGH